MEYRNIEGENKMWKGKRKRKILSNNEDDNSEKYYWKGNSTYQKNICFNVVNWTVKEAKKISRKGKNHGGDLCVWIKRGEKINGKIIARIARDHEKTFEIENWFRNINIHSNWGNCFERYFENLMSEWMSDMDMKN